jgi:tagatose-1,6-bisphosphate aldolase
LKGKKALALDQQGFLKEMMEVKTKANEELRDVTLGENKEVVIRVTSTLTPIQ